MTNSTFSARAIEIVRKHGGAGDVPFLFAYTNDVANAFAAVTCIFSKEGVTSNSLDVVQSFLSVANNANSDQDILATSLMRQVFNQNLEPAIKQRTQTLVMEYARKSTGVRMLDTALIECDPTYSNSTRRLSVLRAASTLSLIDMQMNYATNAISELVAYPEATLPD